MAYYYVGTSLPPLDFGKQPEIKFWQLERLYEDNLSKKDLEKTKVLRKLFDIQNLKAVWKGDALDKRAGLDEIHLEEALVSRIGLPDYVYDYLHQYEKTGDRLRHFPYLMAKFFQVEASQNKGFLHDYFQFERESRLVMTALRAKKLGRDLKEEFQYEDPEEELIALILSQSESKELEVPERYIPLKIIFEKFGDDPWKLEEAIDEYRYNFIESLVEMTDLFSVRRCLAYMAQLMIVEKWFELDQSEGLKIIDTIVKEAT